MQAIIGIELMVTRLEGKYKLSQNKTQTEQQGIITGLESLTAKGSQAMAELMQTKLLLD